MEQAVYVDLYFLVNFSMDLLCLMMTAFLLHRGLRRWRAILGAFLGGGYAVAALLWGLGGGVGIACDLLAACMICGVAFATRREGLWRLLQCVAVQLLVSVLLGGVMTALYAMLNRLDLPVELMQGESASVWIFALLTAVAGLATVKGGSFLGFSKATRSVTVSATLFGKRVTMNALVDSGNLLRDPISGKSVIVADLEHLRGSLPPLLVSACQSGDYTEWLSDHHRARLSRPIPARGATGESLLLAIVPDSLTVGVGSDAYSADYLIAPAPLGAAAKGFDAVIALS